MAENLDDLKGRARDTLRRLSVNPNAENLTAAKGLVESLRNLRDYPAMGRLAEAVSRVDPKDPKNRRLYAQYLIEDGKATAAADILKALARRLPKKPPRTRRGHRANRARIQANFLRCWRQDQRR